MHNISERISKTLYVLKAMAIICVAAAHGPSYTGILAEAIRHLLATIGVPTFLICSGFLYVPGEKKEIFWRKKKNTIVIPWCVWSVLTYSLQVILMGSAFNIVDLFKWTIGFKTWLYFVPVLLICFALNRLIDSDAWIYCQICISIVFWLLCYHGIMPEFKYITYYQNAFIFLMFFEIGRLLRKIKYECWLVICSDIKVKCIILSLVIIIGYYYAQNSQIGYWKSYLSIPFELLSCIMLLEVSYSLRNIELFNCIGKRTYFIFFTHMQIGENVANILFKRLPTGNNIEYFLILLRPMMVVVVSYSLWWILNKILKTVRFDKYSWVLSI